MMVILIVLIIMGMIVTQFRGTKDAAIGGAARQTGDSYREAYANFKLDHAGRVPVPGTDDWSPDLEKGPLNPVADPHTGTRMPYLRDGVPDPVASGRIAVSTSGPDSSKSATIVLVGDGATPSLKFRVEVWFKKNGSYGSAPRCWSGDLTLAGVEEC